MPRKTRRDECRCRCIRLNINEGRLEVGCGPGFFTIPAAKIVGEEGVVYAVDVHPLAIERAKRKIESEGMKNVKPMLANASDTGLQTKVLTLHLFLGFVTSPVGWKML